MAIKVAFFSPLPPARSGIADYSATLLEDLGRLSNVTVFSSAPPRFDPGEFDLALYQIGNNGYHDFCYQTALEHPGVVVIHEANLHHLIADLTIKRGDWDAYLELVAEEGIPGAIEHARSARALKVGPDYEGLPMLRRLLSKSKAAIVHSRCVEEELRKAGFTGPVATIPHGAWIPQVSRLEYRKRLGIEETAPLIGIFGFLKPYKRIPESLRAFRRLVRMDPSARMILAGEVHPDLPLDSLIRSLDLTESVRVLGFQPMDEFVGYIAASDIVLNLRYPTVGENSGTLMRALGLGKAVIVSEVGSFSELPDSVCLKAPVDAGEEDHLFEYMNLLVSRPDMRRQLGARARAWVETECAWPAVARKYTEFLEAVAGRRSFELAPAVREIAEPAAPVEVEPEFIRSWAADKGAANYIDAHITRLEKTLAITPPGGPGDRILEMGAYLMITPALRDRLGYGEVRECYFGPAGQVVHRTAQSTTGETFECDVEMFDAEKDRFPYDDGYFSTVLCCELIEHLTTDPMHMLAEVNRILKPGGHLVLTTPNIASLRAIGAILGGYHPGFFPAYIRPRAAGEEPEARHNREYTAPEVARLFADSGFEVTLLETGPFLTEPKPEQAWVRHLLTRYELPDAYRGDGIYAVGKKSGPVKHRYADWLYQ